MDNNTQKKLAFGYLMYLCLGWYNEKFNIEDNDFSKLKSLKLLFLAAAVKGDLLDIFKFSAMPYGPVESTIYDSINSNDVIYSITARNTTLKGNGSLLDESYFSELNDDIKRNCNDAINMLKYENKDLVYYSAFKLVDITHLWKCWRDTFKKANRNGKNSLLIEKEDILKDIKYFSN